MEEEDLWKDKEEDKKQKNPKKLHKGALIPQTAHLSWKDQINKILK